MTGEQDAVDAISGHGATTHAGRATESDKTCVQSSRYDFERIIASLGYDGNDTNSLTVGEIRRALATSALTVNAIPVTGPACASCEKQPSLNCPNAFCAFKAPALTGVDRETSQSDTDGDGS